MQAARLALILCLAFLALVGAGCRDRSADATALFAATHSRKCGELRRLIAAGVDVNYPFGAKGRTCLHQAAGAGNADVVETLIAAGADANARADDGVTPLQAAVLANDAGMIRLLVAKGADPNLPGFASATALHLATIRGKASAVAALLAAGADPNAPNEQGSSALGSLNGLRQVPDGDDPNAVVAAFERAGVDAPRPYEYAYRQASPPAALAAAAFVGDAGKIRRLLAEGTPVDAAMSGIQDLCAFGTFVDAATHAPYPAPGEDGKTALHWAGIGGQRDAAAALIDGGAKVRATDKGGSTPLHDAAGAGAVAVVSLLLSSGAPVDASSDGGYTPLMRVVQQKPENWLDVVDQLLASGAKINYTDPAGTAPIDLAAHHEDPAALRALMDRGAKASLWNLIEVGETERAIARVKGGASLTATRELQGLPSTPLDYALVCDQPEIATAIRARGGRTSLYRAARESDLATVRWYLRRGADPNAADEQGSTILHSAAGRGDIAMVRLLVKHGADVNAEEDCCGYRPLDHAWFQKHQEVIDYLKCRGAKRGCYLRM